MDSFDGACLAATQICVYKPATSLTATTSSLRRSPTLDSGGFLNDQSLNSSSLLRELRLQTIDEQQTRIPAKLIDIICNNNSSQLTASGAALNTPISSLTNYFNHQQTTNLNKPNIIINSPAGYKPAVYEWPLSNAEEIIDTIKWVANEYPEYKPAIDNLLASHKINSYDDVKCLCDKYNKVTEYVRKMNMGTSVALKTSTRASQGLLKHIMHQVYNHAVAEPEKLNQYPPFSSEVYGETSFDFVSQMINEERTRPNKHDTFIDLGSGVGQVVLQIAASVNCKKCYGIEKSDIPAKYAKDMEEQFIFWMNWHGKTFTEFEIFHGDFFEGRFADIIRESTHIFVNNFAFKPEVDHKLKLKFTDLKDGARIISSKQFCPPNSRVTERNLTDIGSIMHVVEILPEKGSVSWTNKSVPYFLHVLDGAKIEKFYEQRLAKSTARRACNLKKTLNSISKKMTPIKLEIIKPTIVKITQEAIKLKIPKTIVAEATRLRKEKEAKKSLKIEKKKALRRDKSKIQLYNHDLYAAASSLSVVSMDADSGFSHQSSPNSSCRQAVLEPGSNIDSANKQEINYQDGQSIFDPEQMKGLFDGLRGEYNRFIDRIKQPQFKENILNRIKAESAKNSELLRAEEEIAKNILALKERIPKLMEYHCNQLEVVGCSKQNLIRHLGTMLNEHQDLKKELNDLTVETDMSKIPPAVINPPKAHSNNSSSSTLSSYSSSPMISPLMNTLNLPNCFDDIETPLCLSTSPPTLLDYSKSNSEFYRQVPAPIAVNVGIQ